LDFIFQVRTEKHFQTKSSIKVLAIAQRNSAQKPKSKAQLKMNSLYENSTVRIGKSIKIKFDLGFLKRSSTKIGRNVSSASRCASANGLQPGVSCGSSGLRTIGKIKIFS
jgi:ribosomal protein L34